MENYTILVKSESLTEENQKHMFTYNQILWTLKETNYPAENLGKGNVLKFIKKHKGQIIKYWTLIKGNIENK